MAGLFRKFADEGVREAVGEGRQRLRADHTSDLPVADRGVLAHALLLQAGKCADGCAAFFTGGHTVNVEHSQLLQVGAVEIGMLGNGTQRVGARIAKSGGVRLCADAETVQNDQKNTFFHILFSPFPVSPAGSPVHRVLPEKGAFYLSLLYASACISASSLWQTLSYQIFNGSLQRFHLLYCIQAVII